MTLDLSPRQVLGQRVFGGQSVPRAEAFPFWKPILPPYAKPLDSTFTIAAGAELDFHLEFPIDSMVRLLWSRFTACEIVGGRAWDSLSHAVIDDVEDIREGMDFLRWLDMKLVIDSAAGVEIMDYTPISVLHGNDEFGRVRLPYLVGKQAQITLSVRNRYSALLEVAGFVHGWRIKL